MLGRESTFIQSAEESQSSHTTGNSIVTSEASIFYQLPPSELLKHLLAGNQSSSPYCTRTRQDDSCKKQSGVSQNTSDAVIQCDDGVYALCNQYASSTCGSVTQSGQNGSMEKSIIELENRNKQQNSVNVLFSENRCNSSSTATEEEDVLPVLSYHEFNEQSIDDMLAEAQQMLRIEPPSDHERELCTLPQVDASKHEAAEDASKKCSIGKNMFLCHPVESEANSSEQSESDRVKKDFVSNENNASDSGVETTSVLVPAGNTL